MGWKIGDWREYKEGEIDQVTKRCIRVLASQGFRMEATLPSKNKPVNLRSPKAGFLAVLQDYENRKGVNTLLDVLSRGKAQIIATKQDLRINLQLLLRTPQNSEKDAALFKEMIAQWVEQDELSFCERFFRLPKITEDLADRYLDNPLEQVLRKTFGFHFKYKLLISCSIDSPESQQIRETLYEIMAYL